jgi:phage baseplate assembly protein gpV
MRSGSSPSRCGVLLIAIISPALLGSEFKCVAVSNPSGATARIEQIEPLMPRVGDIMRATGSGNGAPPLQFAWDFGDGALASGMQAAHAYMAPGSYRVTLTVRDAAGNTASDSSQVAVSARVPSSVFSLVLVSDAVAGQPVLFEALLPLEEHASALSYVWTFSDGQSAIGPRAAATFPVGGMYLASITVTNDLGAIAVAQIAFHVVDAAH